MQSGKEAVVLTWLHHATHFRKEVVAMKQQFAYPKTEKELQLLSDNIYRFSQSAITRGEPPKIHGLYEIITSEPVILTAIHNIKANKGSNTAGIDKETVRSHILEQNIPES